MKNTWKNALAVLLAGWMTVSCASCAGENAGSDETMAKPEETTVSGETTAAEYEENVIERYTDASVITLSGDGVSLNGEKVEEFDYTWHCDPSQVHDEVKNAPAEYYTGTKPETDAAVYVDHELYYYPLLNEAGFKKVNYDGENEWAYYYTDGENDEYIFATLPVLGNTLPKQMMHTEEEAAENKVLHITKPGKYLLTGKWNGQISVDLGEEDDVFADAEQKVTLILAGAEIECTVAPGIVYRSVYEYDNTWEERGEYSADVDISDAGAVLIIADGTENNVSGTNVFRMLKTKYKDEDSTDAVKVQKKMRKTDGALYSYMTMKIEGGEKNDGKLTVTSGFEGIDSELHLALSGGIITVNSQDDGINVNEDNVSVVIFDGADVTLNAGQGAEGDGVDSNGFIRIDSGKISVSGIRVPDSALDSEDGITYNGGTVVIDGQEQNYTPGSTFRETGRGGTNGDRPFDDRGGRGDPGGDGRFGENFDIKDFKEKVAALGDDATWEDVLALLGMGGFPGDDMPQGEEPPQMPGEMPQNGEPPQPPDKMPENGEIPQPR